MNYHYQRYLIHSFKYIYKKTTYRKIMNTFIKPLVVSSLLLSSLSAISYDAHEEPSTPKDSKSIVDFRFDFDLSNLQGDSESFNKDELSMAANTESYTAKDIEKSQAQDIYDFLNQNSSVHVQPYFGNKASQLLDLGGYGQANGFQNIVIKINGRRINNIDGVPQLLSSISLDSIEKIDILKGAGSVLNGDGATGGVINIKLKKSSTLGYKVYAGSFETKYSQLRAGYKGEKLFIQAMTDYYDTNGNRYISTEDKDAQEIINSNFNLSYMPHEKIELLLNYNRSDIDVNYAKPLTLAQYNENPNQAGSGYTPQLLATRSYGTGINLKLAKNFTLVSNVSYEEKRSEYPSFSSLYLYQYVPFDLTLKFAAKNFELKTGIDGFEGKREATDNITTKDNLASFISLAYTLDKKHGYRLGYRAENVSYNYTPQSGAVLDDEHDLKAVEAGYAYKIDASQSLYMNFNHAFLAPNIDAFFNFGGTFNAFIEPQKVETSTLGFKHITKKHVFKSSIFYSRLHNEIYYNANTFQNTNLDETQKLGFNLYDKYQLNTLFSASVNYNYVRATILSEEDDASFTGKKLPGTPPHSVTLAGTYKFDKKSKLNISQNYRSQTYSSNDFANSLAQKQEAYTSTDLAFSYNHSKELKFFSKIQNLFNQANGIWTKDDNIYPVNFETNIQIGLKGSF